MLMAVILESDGRIFNYKNVEKININGKDINIGYFDDSGEYHEEIGDTLSMIVINMEEPNEQTSETTV